MDLSRWQTPGAVWNTRRCAGIRGFASGCVLNVATSMNNDFNLPSPDPADAPLQTAREYQDERHALVPALYKTTHERLAVELALKMDDPQDIFLRYGYTLDEGLALLELPAFSVMLARIGAEIAQNGLSFKAKIRAIAEDLLPTAHALATDPLTSAAVRKDIIIWAGKMAGHEPKEEKGAQVGGGGLNLSITFSGQAPTQVVGNVSPSLEAA